MIEFSLYGRTIKICGDVLPTESYFFLIPDNRKELTEYQHLHPFFQLSLKSDYGTKVN